MTLMIETVHGSRFKTPYSSVIACSDLPASDYDFYLGCDFVHRLRPNAIRKLLCHASYLYVSIDDPLLLFLIVRRREGR